MAYSTLVTAQTSARSLLRHALATLAYRAGKALRGESYFRSDIEIGRVGKDQAAPRREFD